MVPAVLLLIWLQSQAMVQPIASFFVFVLTKPFEGALPRRRRVKITAREVVSHRDRPTLRAEHCPASGE